MQARNAAAADEVLREAEGKSVEATITCPACGEESPENFETCWSCGAVLPADEG